MSFASQPGSGMSRRHFLGHLRSTALGVPAMHFFNALRAQAQSVRGRRSCILLWMSGGPSHLDIWDLKPESERNGGPFRPIDTSVPGIRISEHLPLLARQMHHLSLVRSLDSKEGNHDRGTYLMHTGYPPTPAIVHPGWGSICAYELGDRLSGLDLPPCVAINEPGVGAGFLGMSYAPFVVQNPSGRIADFDPPAELSPLRRERRLQMLAETENAFLARRKSQLALDHKLIYSKTLRLMNSNQKEVFNLETEPAAVRDAYGRGSFGSGCLLARRLVALGVPYVEVSLGGWDTHADNFETLSRRLLPELDRGMSALVADLARNGLLDSTLVVWMGEFGRTPRINQNAGRDHWPRSWSVVLGGAGLTGGQLVGATDKDGVEIVDRPVSVMDLIATMTKAMGINIQTQYTTPRGRPMKIVDGGQPIHELLS